jgi:PAS domain S-box-containing protein
MKNKHSEKMRNCLATVVEQSDNAIYIHDSKGKIIFWNKGAEKMYGYSEQEALKMKVETIIPEHIQQEMEAIMHKVLNGEKIENLDTKKISKNGKLIDVSLSASVLHETENDTRSIAVTETDITDRKIAEVQMIKSEARFKDLFQNAPYPMWVYDLKTLEFLEVNQTAVSSYGYSREEFLLMTIGDIRPTDDIPRLIDDVKNRPEPTGLWVHQLKNGQLIDVEITSHLVDFQGRKGSLVIAINITERKKVEEKVRLLNAELKTNIQLLETTNSELESFSYSVSHDLRAPLRAMNGYSKMLEEDYAAVIDSEGKRLLGNIQSNAAKMGMLIDDLLTFSRLGRKEIQKSLINNKALVDDVVSEIKNLPGIGAEIKIARLPDSYADQGLIRQAWLNLLSNAVKYSSKKEKPVIEIGSAKLENEIMYFIKDNGAGFNMKYADKLFGVFQRLHNPNEFEGTGIGLAIVQRIINKHGGRVWAESKVDEGATFYFTLPECKK